MNQFTGRETVPQTIRTISMKGIAERGCFYTGGEYVAQGDDFVMAGQMYVEVYIPERLLHPYPLVLIHGNGQTGSCFLQTLEGKPGWVSDFVAHGFVVYVVDQPERGRSVCHSSINGERIAWPARASARQFAGQSAFPGSKRHTQWPAGEAIGDPSYDDFYRTQVDSLNSAATGQRLIQKAGTALLEQIGPAVLLCHSQAGPFAWILANERPELVKAAVSIEPSGPPFADARTGEAVLDESGRPANYGISYVPLEFDPPISSPALLRLERRIADTPDRQSGFLQKEPARKLTRLADIPMLILSGEASYHAPFDYLTAEFLQQAGVDAEYVNLGEVGIHGNGHMMMLEKNSSEIAGWIAGWISEKTLGGMEK